MCVMSRQVTNHGARWYVESVASRPRHGEVGEDDQGKKVVQGVKELSQIHSPDFTRPLAASRGFHRCSMKCDLDRCGSGPSDSCS